jgi:hypothetical protein
MLGMVETPEQQIVFWPSKDVTDMVSRGTTDTMLLHWQSLQRCNVIFLDGYLA